MSDERVRDAERCFRKTRSLEDEVRWRRELLRSGEVTPSMARQRAVFCAVVGFDRGDGSNAEVGARAERFALEVDALCARDPWVLSLPAPRDPFVLARRVETRLLVPSVAYLAHALGELQRALDVPLTASAPSPQPRVSLSGSCELEYGLLRQTAEPDPYSAWVRVAIRSEADADPVRFERRSLSVAGLSPEELVARVAAFENGFERAMREGLFTGLVVTVLAMRAAPREGDERAFRDCGSQTLRFALRRLDQEPVEAVASFRVSAVPFARLTEMAPLGVRVLGVEGDDVRGTVPLRNLHLLEEVADNRGARLSADVVGWAPLPE